MNKTTNYNAFISYRREGGAYIARALREGIEKANEALNVFIDLDELSAGNFNDALIKVISESPNFIFVVSKGVFERCKNESDWVRKELSTAIQLKRNIIPVFEAGITFPDEISLPEDIRSIVAFNGVEYSPQHHHEALKKIVSFFKVDSIETDERRRHRINHYFERQMVRIPSGKFIMGSMNGKKDEIPLREVNISEFWMMKYPVTQREYQSLMNVNPGNFRHDQKPVQNVSWFDAIVFCNKWSNRDNLQPVYEIDERSGGVKTFFERVGYRLPTEAEWEYACRAGNSCEFHWGDEESEWNKFAWHDRNSDDQVHIVGSRHANSWGLFDMTGNVYEWCNDWYEADYYSFNETDNPRGPDREFGEYRVMRGGAWAYDPIRLRSAARLKRDPNLTDDVSGFRCVINTFPCL
ncbi:MAG: SUMF1/EgtB/PvdO family nonheme iron enzyme [Thiobacillus sp.]